MNQESYEFEAQFSRIKNNSISKDIKEKTPEIINEINNNKMNKINQNCFLSKENDGNVIKNLKNEIQSVSKKKIYNTFSHEFKKKVLEDVN